MWNIYRNNGGRFFLPEHIDDCLYEVFQMILNGRENLTGASGLLIAIIGQAFKDASSTATSDSARAAKADALQWFEAGEYLPILDAIEADCPRVPRILLEETK